MPQLQCSVVTPTEQLLNAEVRSVVLPAHDGLMGVQPGHAAMLVQLGEGDLKAETSDGQQTLKIRGGFAQIRENTVTVLTEDA